MDKNQIKSERIKRGLTQEELGKKIGVTRGTIANYESGDTTPDNNKIELLKNLFFDGQIKKDISKDYVAPKLSEEHKTIITNAFLQNREEVFNLRAVKLVFDSKLKDQKIQMLQDFIKDKKTWKKNN